MGLADFDFLPSVPQTFWGFPPFLYFTCKHSYDPTWCFSLGRSLPAKQVVR